VRREASPHRDQRRLKDVQRIVAPPAVTGAIRKVHDFLTVSAPAPLQEACAAALAQLGAEC
jgi:hypothetical protein